MALPVEEALPIIDALIRGEIQPEEAARMIFGDGQSSGGDDDFPAAASAEGSDDFERPSVASTQPTGPFLFGVGPEKGFSQFAPDLSEPERFGDPKVEYSVGTPLSPVIATMFPALREPLLTNPDLTEIADKLAGTKLASNMTLGGLLQGLAGALTTVATDPRKRSLLPKEVFADEENRAGFSPSRFAEYMLGRNLVRVTPEVDYEAGLPTRVYTYESGRKVTEPIRSVGALGLKPAVSQSGREYAIGYGDRLFERRGDVIGRETTPEALNAPLPERIPHPREADYPSRDGIDVADRVSPPAGSNLRDRGNWVIVSKDRDRAVFAPAGSKASVVGQPGERVVIIRLPDGTQWRYDAETGLPLGRNTPYPYPIGT